jgi:hypothetical protein
MSLLIARIIYDIKIISLEPLICKRGSFIAIATIIIAVVTLTL